MTDQEMIRAARRIMNVIGRGTIALVDDSGQVQRHQVDLGPQGPLGSLEIQDDLPFVGVWGVAGNPPAGSNAVIVFMGGDRSRGIVLGVNHQVFRLKNLGPGESALYDEWGNIVKLTEAGMEITHSARITLTAPIVDVEGDLQVGGVSVTVP